MVALDRKCEVAKLRLALPFWRTGDRKKWQNSFDVADAKRKTLRHKMKAVAAR